jgi:uncharacterized membrane-anchored protein YhcB (DUF1043 family)
MYPDTPPPPTPIDYLNQIAPQPQKPGINKRALIVVVLGIGLVLAVVIGFIAFVTSSANGPKESAVVLTARMQAMETVAEASQPKIKSSSLRGINRSLIIFLTNANRDIATPLTANGISVEKLDKAIVAKEQADPITANLEEARLNAVFDDTYAREMSFKLATVALLMEEISSTTKSQSMKEFLSTTSTNLEPIKQQLDEFNKTAR